MVTDTVADVLTRIRNAQRAGHASVRMPASKMTKRVLDVLQKEGFIADVEASKDRKEKFDEYNVELKYTGSGDPVITLLKRVSTPGRRVYTGVGDLPKVHAGLGIALVSTSKGVMSDHEARKQHLGGEVLALVA